MRKRWLKPDSTLEARLRAFRAQPRDELVDGLSQRLTATPGATPRAWSRLAFAGAVSVFILGTVASFGGISYAASGAASTYKAVKQVPVKQAFFVSVHKSSAADQYRHTPPKKNVFEASYGSIVSVSDITKYASAAPVTAPSKRVASLLRKLSARNAAMTRHTAYDSSRTGMKPMIPCSARAPKYVLCGHGCDSTPETVAGGRFCPTAL